MKLRFLVLILAILLICAGCSDKIENFPNLDTYTEHDIQDDSKEMANSEVDGTVTDNDNVEIEAEVSPSDESVLTPEFVQNSIVGGYWVGVDMDYSSYLIQFLDDGTAELTPFSYAFVNYGSYDSENEEPSPENSIYFNDYYIPTGEYFIDEQDNSIVLAVSTYDYPKYFRLNYNSDDKCIHYNNYGYYSNYACDIKFIHFDSMPTVQQLYDHLGWSTNYKTYDVDFNKPIIGLKSRLYDDRVFMEFVKDNASDIFNFISNDSNYHFNIAPVSYYEMAGGKGAEICDSRVSSMADVQKYFELYVSKNVDISGKMYHYHEENGKLYANYGDKGGLLESLDNIYPYDVKYVSDSVVEIMGSCILSEPDFTKNSSFNITLVLENGYWKFDSFVISPGLYTESDELLKHKQ